MNIRNFLFSHQTETIEQPESVIVREDFIISNCDQMTIDQLLTALRDRTYEFALNNSLVSATTEFSYIDELPIIVKLTEDYDFMYTVNGFKTYSFTDAVAVITDAIQF